ncbi:uncharacterized protein LOC126736675 [Anthonomus grandis grandis]|uniref:uncharacterized protein LOC126736675 n=1 Tax=Anthonomus grandis grandis TaxID=2921223 RepID=UPI0021658E36|nr:uncharacterized protein LOC126736675 [Anthonomus grandis grandis]
MSSPLRKRSRVSSSDRGMLSEILKSVKSLDERLKSVENERRSSCRNRRSMSRRRDRSRRRRLSSSSRDSGSGRSGRFSRSRKRKTHRVRRPILPSSSDWSQSQGSCEREREEGRGAAQPSSAGQGENVIGDVDLVSTRDLQPIAVDIEQDSDVQVSINREFQALLGDEDVSPTLFAPSLHGDIASRWDVILRKGMDLENRKTLIAKYAPPQNCQNILPPNLNPHVKAALSESNVRRDDRLVNLQKQVGAGIAAVGKVLSILYERGKEADKENILALGDAGRLLADVHFQETMSRRDLVLLNINKDLKDTLSNSPPDEWLFGGNLEEVIKAKKAIDVSSQQLKSKKVVRKPLQPLRTQHLNSVRPLRSSIRGSYRSGQQPRQAPRQKVQSQFRRKPDQWQSRDRRL